MIQQINLLLKTKSLFYPSFIFFVCLILFALSCTPRKPNLTQKAHLNSFKYHIPLTPQSFDPILQKGTTARFLFTQIYRPLVSYGPDNQLQFNAAQNCLWKKSNYICHLRPLNFEDGSPIQSQNYKFSFELIDQEKSASSTLFKYLKHENPSQDILTPNPQTIIFQFKRYAPFLAHFLSDISYSPRKEKKLYLKADDVLASGSFKIDTYKKNQWLHLKSNNINNSIFNLKKRPSVTIYFIEEEATVMSLFNSNHLDLVRNLRRTHFDRYKGQIQFVNMMRMDGLGFGGLALKDKNLRQALAHSLKYSDLQKIYKSKGKPGCPAIPKSFYTQNHCYDFDASKAQNFFAKVSKKMKNHTFKINFSEVGGEDIKMGMEWLAYQWKKNLGLQVSIEPLESGQFFQRIRNKNFEIIRKGLPLDTPTCIEALQSFQSDSAQNFSSVKSKSLDTLVKKMEALPLNRHNQMQRLCDRGLKILQESYHFIPLGEIYFAFLSNQRFKGWTVNSLNIINLDHLQRVKNGSKSRHH